MDWQRQLLPDEKVLWQGRPAPRCYTFRNWKLATIGLVLFLVSSFWQMLGLQLADEGYAWHLILIPLPLVVATFIMGPGQILLARLEWERLFYCLTDQRLLQKVGFLKRRIRVIPRSEIISWQQKRHGEQLASVRLQLQAGQGYIILHCLEQPQSFFDILGLPTP